METLNHHHLKNVYIASKPSDNILSNLNQVYYVTKQVPQQSHVKPCLTFLPIIQNAPTNSRSTFMSSALLSSVHSIDLDSIKTTNKIPYFKTVIGPKRKSSANPLLGSFNLTRNARSCSSVINIQPKSIKGLVVQNTKPEDTEFRLNTRQLSLKATASASVIRDKKKERALSRTLTLSTFESNKVSNHLHIQVLILFIK